MKIFGIGLSKTGTKSLSKALDILGFHSIHYPNDPKTRQQISAKDFHLSIMDNYEAAVDTPIAVHYKELDAAFPNSKFILTTRGMDSWLDSMRFHLAIDQLILKDVKQVDSETKERIEFLFAMYFAQYKGNSFQEIYNNLELIYRSHHEKVKDYFRGKNNLLVLEVDDKDKWRKLSSFLGVEAPIDPYPSEGKRTEIIQKVSGWPVGLDKRYFSEELHESVSGIARTFTYRYDKSLNLKKAKILNVCRAGGEFAKVMSNYDIVDWVIGDKPPIGRFDIIVAYDVLDHLISELDATAVLGDINRISSLDATLYLVCHPHSSRVGTHLLSENKAYLHLLCPDYPGQKETLRLANPLISYRKWIAESNWEIKSERLTTEIMEDFFLPFIQLKKHNTEIQFVEYMLKKSPKLFL